jgi:biotin carboxylase
MGAAVRRAKPQARIVLLLPTETYRASAFFDAAAALDAEVVVATEHSPPLATAMEDRLVDVDFDQPEVSAARIAALAERVPVDAVVGVDDRGVLTAAHASELLGLAHNPPDAVAATRDKVEMRSVLASWDVPQPVFRVAGAGADIASLAVEVGLPCVVKPVSLAASTGVIRADTPGDAAEVGERVRNILAKHERPCDELLLVEQFVAGAEVSFEGLLRNGELEMLALFDKPDALDGPYFEETIYVTPSRLSDAQRDAVLATTAAGCRALGLREGPVHAELRVGDDTTGDPPAVWVLEVAARSIGGLCSRVLRFGAGISLEEVVLRHALGLDTSQLARCTEAAGVMMLPIPRTGILDDVAGIEAARAVSGITGVEITARRGRLIEALPEGGRYLGFLFAAGDTPAQVEESLREAHASLEINIIDEPAATP